MNREQKRAQLKALGKKFSGINVSNGILDVPIVGSKETLQVDLMNFGTTMHLMRMCDLFLNMKEHHKDELEAVEAETDKFKSALMFGEIYERMCAEFMSHVEAVFGEGSMKKIFGNIQPVPEAIKQFVHSVAPIVQAAASMMNGGLESGVDDSTLKTAAAATAAAGREGNA